MTFQWSLFVVGIVTPFALAGQTVTLYTSIDQPQAKAIADRFTRETGIDVRLVTDGEATKTAGLAERLLAEKDRPRADVYWNNEVFHTIRLAQQDCFEPLPPKIVSRAPAPFVDDKAMWVGVGLRARVIIAQPALEPQPKSIHELTGPQFKQQIAIAHPAFGTTSGHIAFLFQSLGEDKFVELMNGLKANHVKLVGGNSVVAQLVADQTLMAGLTDNDDVAAVRSRGATVVSIEPTDFDSTLLIPSTVSLVRGAPQREAAVRLIDFLTNDVVEDQLVKDKFFAHKVSDFANRPQPLLIDYTAIARGMPKAVKLALDILQQ